ncbi:hypothetical protein ACFYVL_09210 [Streptomyces sp. NPDC004111]|uniref:hypothetical protein n=1 Tax=Streptomyces sp. NPDC004111 TaxID=3364690 RepID=UPI0036956203
MSASTRPSSMDEPLVNLYGRTVAELQGLAGGPDASPAMVRALELRSFLALAEEQVAQVRDRVRAAMAPDRDMGDLSAESLRFDAQWLEAALATRDGYRNALDDLLRTMPPPAPSSRPLSTTPAAAPPQPAAPLRRAGAPQPR